MHKKMSNPIPHLLIKQIISNLMIQNEEKCIEI